MKFEALLTKPEYIVPAGVKGVKNEKQLKEELLREGFTATDVTCITGIEVQEGGGGSHQPRMLEAAGSVPGHSFQCGNDRKR